jgi:hypothetical protein
MPTPINPVAGALAHALTNDRYGAGGVVSARDARSIVDAALDHIAASDKPEDVYAYDMRFIDAAKSMLGRSADAARRLNTFEARGMNAVNARLAQLGQDLALPAAAQDAAARAIGWRVNADDVTFTNEKNVGTDAFTFDYEHNGRTGSGFLVKFEGQWIHSPIQFDPAILPDVLAEAKDHFDTDVALWARDYHDADELADYRADISIRALRVNEDPDDYDKTDEGFEPGFPYEFRIDGGAPGDGGLYVGFKPSSGDLNGFGRWA